jgi:hypothetical protein
MIIQSINGKMMSAWDEKVKAVVDTWISYRVSLEEFKEAIAYKALRHARINKGRAFIVDSKNATGAFTLDIHDYIKNGLFQSFIRSGIKYFITILSDKSPTTSLTVHNYSSLAGPSGLKVMTANSVADAILWLELNDKPEVKSATTAIS